MTFIKVKNVETSEYLLVNLELTAFVRLIKTELDDPTEGFSIISFGPNNYFTMDKESTQKVCKAIELHSLNVLYVNELKE